MNYNLGRILPIYRGEYEVGTTYNKLDIVYVAGYGSFVAKQTVSSVQPQDNPEIWQIVAADCTNEELVETFNANEAEREQRVNNFILNKSQELSTLINEVNNEVNAKLSEVDSNMQTINTEWGGMKNTMNNQFNAAQTERDNTFTVNEQQRENTLNTAITNIENSDTAFKNSLQSETSEWLNEKEVEFNEAQTERASEFNSTMTSMNGQFNAAQANRTTTFNNSESERATTFTTNETARQNTFNTNENARQDEFDSKEAARDEATQAIINEHDYLVALDNTKANKDGYYSTLTAGAAENLVGDSVDSEIYLIRPTGGQSNEVANGVASVIGMEGNSVVWNQLIPSTAISTQTVQGVTITNNGDGSYTCNGTSISQIQLPLATNMISEHIYYVAGGADGGSSSTYRINSYNVGVNNSSERICFESTYTGQDYPQIQIFSGVTLNNAVFRPVFIDLTQMFGAGNEPTSVSQFEKWLAQNVGTKPYYEYNEGTVFSAKTTGFNTYSQNLLNPETKQAKLIPYIWEDNNNVYTVKNIPTEATATYTPDNTGVAETITITNNEFDITQYGSGVLEFSDVNTDSYVCMKWDGSMDNEIVPYEEHNYSFDVTKVYGKVNGEGEYIQCFPDGLYKAGTVADTLTADSAVKKIGSMDLGNLTWNKYPDTTAYGTTFYSSRISNAKTTGENIVCSRYTSTVFMWKTPQDDSCYWGVNGWHINRLCIHDESYSTAPTPQDNWLDSVMLYYELATPITYTNLIYRDNNTDTPIEDILLNIDVDNWSMEQQTVQTNSLPAKVSAIYGMNAVEAIDTLQKSTYTETDIYNNLSALLASINTNCSTVLGGTFSISDTATDKVFQFTFTQNEEGEGQ